MKIYFGDENEMKPLNFKKSKKAQFFSILAILIISLMFFSFEIFSVISERNVIKTRVSTMDNFLNSVEENLERQMFISGFRIIFLAENYITSTGDYINVDSVFNEAFFNGTIYGVNDSILLGATYDDLLISLNQKAKKINVDITLTNSTINISQDDPWNVKFTLTSDFVMEDKEGLAKWEKTQVISAFIPVTDFEDPIYVVNTLAKVSRKINKTIYEGNYVSGADVSNLLSHVNNGYYAENSDAPSFLKRLEGSVSADPNGIESFVNIPEISQQGITTYEKTTMDYIYFSTNNPPYYSVSGMPAWFYIDNEDDHLNKYQVSGLAS